MLCCAVQAVKTVLNYLSETNGELHYFLHNYVRIYADPADITSALQHTATR